MDKIENFSIDSAPLWAVHAALTHSQDYYERRLLLLENWPEYGGLTVIEGSHCSCYGFDDTEWDAMTYEPQELLQVIRGWHNNSYDDIEKEMAVIVWRLLVYKYYAPWSNNQIAAGPKGHELPLHEIADLHELFTGEEWYYKPEKELA